MDRLDRNRLMVGVYCLKNYAWSEKHIQDLAHAGVNYLCSAPADRELLDRCQKYGIGVFATGVLPGWWGGYGENAGGFAESAPLSKYREAAEKFRDHPAVWGLDMGDEPSALDFPHYGKVFEETKRLFPAQIPYLNIYPSYGVNAATTGEQRRAQLGTEAHAEYIEKFVECVDCDYICFDYYMYSDAAAGAYEDLRVVSDQCRRSGRDLWMVLQVNSNRPEEWITLRQLRHQAYAALAFGARAVCWACWTAGWWHNQVLDEKGEKTRQYDRICTVNRELHALGERYMKYRNVSTHFIGFDGRADMERVGQEAVQSVDAGAFRTVSADDGFSAIVGHMKGPDGAEALMIADATDAMGQDERTYCVRFASDRKPTAFLNGLPVPVLEAEDGRYMVRMEACAGLLMEV